MLRSDGPVRRRAVSLSGSKSRYLDLVVLGDVEELLPRIKLGNYKRDGLARCFAGVGEVQ